MPNESTRREGTEHMRAVVEKVVHPDFDNDVEEVGVPLNDIALLRVQVSQSNQIECNPSHFRVVGTWQRVKTPIL